MKEVVSMILFIKVSCGGKMSEKKENAEQYDNSGSNWKRPQRVKGRSAKGRD